MLSASALTLTDARFQMVHSARLYRLSTIKHHVGAVLARDTASHPV
jgi:hypothetical protein